MKDLYRGFKKVSDDDKSAKLRHENGHELTIAKSGLNKSTLKMLDKLPLYQADGTELGNGMAAEELEKEMAAAKAGKSMPLQQEAKSQLQTQSIGQQIAEEVKNEIAQGAANATSAATGEPVQKIAGTMAGEVPAQLPSNIMSGGGSREIMPPTTPSPLDIAAQGFLPGQGGLNYEQLKQKAQEKIDLQAAQRQQEQSLGKQSLAPATEAPSFEEYMASQGKELPQIAPETVAQQPTTIAQPQIATPKAVAKPRTPQEILSDPNASMSDKYEAHLKMADDYTKQMAAEDARFEEAMKNEEINPNRIYGNMNFGQRVSTIIGLLIGGLGAGLAGGENLVQKMLDKQVEMDVEEQKRQSTKKQNLYKIHLERLGNQRDAEIATANNLKQAALIKMEEAAGMYFGNKAAQERIQNQMFTLRFDTEQKRAGLAAARAQRDAIELAKKTGTEIPDQNDPRMEKSVRIVVPGQIGLKKMYARNPQEAAKLQEKASALASVKKTLDNLGRIYAEASSSATGLSGKRRDDAVAELAQAKLDLIKAQDLSPKLAEELDSILGTAGSLESFKPGFTAKAEERRRKALTIINQISNSLIEGNLTN